MPTHRNRPSHPQGRNSIALLRGLLATGLLTVLVAGIPWGLVHYIGRPLPRTVPTWPEIETLLLTPMSTTFLLNALACLLWTAWAAFLLDITRAVLDELRVLPRPALPRTGPLSTLAAALVSAILVTVLARPAVAEPPTTTPVSTSLQVKKVDVLATAPTHTQAQRRTTRTVEVRPPRDGIHDSLWRIAERTLGDGNRWPQIYALNHGRPQPDGHTLTHPDLIRPGWILRLPDRPAQTTPAPVPPPRSNTPTTPSPSPTPTTPTPPTNTPTPHAQPGISLPTGAYVSIGLAGLVTAALLTARRRHRIRYRPGSGDRSDLTLAPVVRALRLAHDEATPHSTGEAEAPASPPETGQPVGVKDGQTLALDLARTRGIGLIGQGAPDAARALVVTALAQPPNGATEFIIPAPDAHTLLGDLTSHPATLHIVPDLDAALDQMETELLTRTHSTPSGALILVATPAPHAEHRLQAVLDNGSTLRLAGILLGQWPPGGTAHVHSDGIVAATSTSLSTLTGTRLFTLPAPDTHDLLHLLHQAQPPQHPVSENPSVIPLRTPRRRDTTALPPPANPPSTPDPPRREPPRKDNPTRPPTSESTPTNLRSSPNLPDTEDADDIEHPPPLHLCVLGRIRLLHQPDDGDPTDLTAALTPRQREVLAYLALHRNGARRETLTTTLWPDAPPDRPSNTFHATVSQLRRTLRTATHDTVTDITTHTDSYYALDPHRTTVDLWNLQHALTITHHLPEHDRRHALQHAIDLYPDDFAADLTADWTDAPRETLRRGVLDAVSSLVRILRTTDPEEALTLLEHARTLDRYNEAVYRDIARFQAHLGHHDAVPRTLTLLTTVLTEIDEEPSAETRELYAALQQHRPSRQTTGRRPAD
ncbi:winged helix-turn-helix domain-containing protein [Streptomyces sp. NPDC004539]|uniref:winged helix-turn-helix domain-containing protein n=1 Tax=Streptomyces sp. NPDC004539 TaxID=3154280 RepID=UPI00339E646B